MSTAPFRHRNRFAIPLLCFWYLAVAAMTAALVSGILPLPPANYSQTSMEFSQAPAMTSETRVTLPDNWRNHPERSGQDGTYRETFDYPAEGGAWAVFVPTYSGRLSVKVNGTEIAESDLFGRGKIPDQNVPIIATLPDGNLEPSGNALEITLTPGGLLTGFLAPLYVGPETDLRDSYAWHYFRAVRGPALLIFWQLLLATMLLLLWWVRRREVAAFYCALMLLGASIHGLPVYLPQSPALADLLSAFAYVANFWESSFALLFVYGLMDKSPPLRPIYFMIIPALATALQLVAPGPATEFITSYVVIPVSMLQLFWAISLLVLCSLRDSRVDCHIVLISTLGCGVLAIHDVLVIANVLDQTNTLTFKVAFILLLPPFSGIFIYRLIAAMNRVDELVSSLEGRIEAKESQLREAFDQRRELEKRQALSQERQRIMQDVHDGVGGQLMSIIAMTSSGSPRSDDIESSARAALEDLRVVIGSLDVEDDIAVILGTFRERAEQQLALHGIELHWQMIELPSVEGFSPSSALNMLRILQEAVTNAAKHSGARNLTIRFTLLGDANDALQIDIEDDGCGMDSNQKAGYGLKNMESRAAALDGSIAVSTSTDGSCVRFTMPMKQEGEGHQAP